MKSASSGLIACVCARDTARAHAKGFTQGGGAGEGGGGYLILEAEDVSAPGAAHMLGLFKGAGLLARSIAPAGGLHAIFISTFMILIGAAAAVPMVRRGEEVADTA